MVKGITRQVIVVHSPDPKLFEQAIFILKDEAVEKGITEEALLQEARNCIGMRQGRMRKMYHYGPLWACGGAFITGVLWIVSAIL